MQLSKHFKLEEFTKSMTATRKGIDNSPGAGGGSQQAKSGGSSPSGGWGGGWGWSKGGIVELLK